MTQTDGEKELVLGNKQLISLFFVVVALCGVFFAMGYIIGRNTSKPVTANLETPASAVPQVQEPEHQRETVHVETQPLVETSPASADTTGAQLTQAAHDLPAHDPAPPPQTLAAK